LILCAWPTRIGNGWEAGGHSRDFLENLENAPIFGEDV